MEKISTGKYFLKLVYAALAVCAVLMVCYFYNVERSNTIINFDNVHIMNDGWTLEGTENSKISLPYRVNDSYDKHIIISRIIDEEFVKGNSTMCISSYYCDANVYINNKLIFNYESYKGGIGKTDGVVCLMVKLPEVKENSKLTIEYIPQFKMNSYKIKSPIIGDKGDIIMNSYKKCAFDTSILLIFIIIGIVLIFVEIFSIGKIRIEVGLINTGMLSLFLGIYLISRIEWVHMILRNQKILYVSEFLSMALFTLPILLLIYKFTYYKYKVIFKSLAIINLINFIGQIIVYSCGKMELRNMINYTHIVLFISSFLIIVVVIVWGGETITKLGLKKAVIALCISGICEIISYYTGVFAVGKCMTIGMLIFVTLQMRFNVKKYIQIYRDIKNTEIYENLAYIDLLTGISNRNAYERDLITLDEKKNQLKSIQFVMIDINGLKAANDNYGHAAGDVLIKSFGRILRNSIDERYKLYRIGGDEFVIIFENTSKERIMRKLGEITRRTYEYNTRADVKISYALGMAAYTSKKHRSIKEAIEEADSIMYANKVAAKTCRA